MDDFLENNGKPKQYSDDESPQVSQKVQPDAFISRLAGMCKYAINKREGKVSIEELAVAMQTHQDTVRLGLDWLEAGGHISILKGEDVYMYLSVGDGASNPSLQRELYVELKESLLKERDNQNNSHLSSNDSFRQVAITLTIENWKAIMSFIKHSCQLKGNDWIQWGQGINQYIQSSIEKTIKENGINDITRTTVSSGNLRSVGYDVKTKTLEIQFNNGFVYQYYQIPQEIYLSLMKAESQGSYFYARIRNQFPYQKVGYEPVQAIRKSSYNRFSENDRENFDYGDEGYDMSDLKSDLGMDFMSDSEFDNWMDDHTGGRD